jgi:hemerythrin superfamily protein
MLVTDLIAEDHRTIRRLFLEARAARPPARDLLQRLLSELDVHARAEEEVFYAAMRELSRRVDDGEDGHDHMRAVMDALVAAEPGSRELTQTLVRLEQVVLAHAMEEEGGLLMEAGRLDDGRLEALGAAMEERKHALRQSPRRAA